MGLSCSTCNLWTAAWQIYFSRCADTLLFFFPLLQASTAHPWFQAGHLVNSSSHAAISHSSSPFPTGGLTHSLPLPKAGFSTHWDFHYRLSHSIFIRLAVHQYPSGLSSSPTLCSALHVPDPGA